MPHGLKRSFRKLGEGVDILASDDDGVRAMELSPGLLNQQDPDLSMLSVVSEVGLLTVFTNWDEVIDHDRLSLTVDDEVDLVASSCVYFAGAEQAGYHFLVKVGQAGQRL